MVPLVLRSRARVCLRACALAAVVMLSPAAPALAEWSASPVQLFATTAQCPLVAACSDAAGGAIVVWQENTASPDGVLRAAHVGVTGIVDGAWASPASVCATAVARGSLGAVADGLGGAYVWWTENLSLYLTRIAPDGTIASGWPARGRLLGQLVRSALRPSAIADGAHGVYVGWLQSTPLDPALSRFEAAHLGPANTGAGGWTSGARVIGATADQVERANAQAIGLAADGGLWAAWGTTVVTPDIGDQPGDWRLVRLTSAGLPATGWDGHGISLGVFHGEWLDGTDWNTVPGMSLVGVAADAAGGAFVLRGDLAQDPYGVTSSTPHVFRYDGLGAPIADWPAAGVMPAVGGFFPASDMGPDASMRLMPDGGSGVLAGCASGFSEGFMGYQVTRLSATGGTLSGGIGVFDAHGSEVVPRGDGGVYVTSFSCCGPAGPYQPSAYVSAAQSAPGTGYGESHDDPVVFWYGDVAITATGDGDAIFAWSQANQRYGIYAVRLNPTGPVTGVTPADGAPGTRLALHFAPGAGVRAWARLAGNGPAVVTVHDLAGRELARATFDAVAGEQTWTLPGTASLPAGLYFTRVRTASEQLDGRVVVTR